MQVLYEVVTEAGEVRSDRCLEHEFGERLGLHTMRGETVRFQTVRVAERQIVMPPESAHDDNYRLELMARKKETETKLLMETYEHRDKRRVNNPPVGLVTNDMGVTIGDNREQSVDTCDCLSVIGASARRDDVRSAHELRHCLEIYQGRVYASGHAEAYNEVRQRMRDNGDDPDVYTVTVEERLPGVWHFTAKKDISS